MLERVWRKGNALALLMGISIDTATMEESMESPLKTRNKTTYNAAIPLLGIYPEETKIIKRHMYFIIHCSTIYNSWNLEAT